MRLTNYMKENLINIIKNQTTNPMIAIEEECEKLLQSWVFSKCDPCVVQFHNLYGLYETDTIVFYTKKHNKYLKARVPFYRWFDSDRNEFKLETSNVNSLKWSMVVEKYPELGEIADKYQEGIKQEEEYLEHLKNVESIIYNCSTDTRLAEVFPEFVQFFNAAGIVKKVTPQLPAKLGLPEALCKYGFKLETVESVEEQIREETNE